jgi:hypothetical protein
LLVFILEKAGTDAPSVSRSRLISSTLPAIPWRDARDCDNRRAKGGETNTTTGDSGQPRQDGPAFMMGSSGAPTRGVWIMWSMTENQTKP